MAKSRKEFSAVFSAEISAHAQLICKRLAKLCLSDDVPPKVNLQAISLVLQHGMPILDSPGSEVSEDFARWLQEQHAAYSTKAQPLPLEVSGGPST